MRGERLTVTIALAVNAVIALLKGWVGLMSGSSAMLAEAAHSIADTTNQGFLLVSLSLAEREPDEQHPFGYGKERFLWSFMASLFMFTAGAIFSFARGFYVLFVGHIHFLVSGSGGERYWLLYAILGFALLAEGTSLVRALTQTIPEARARGLGLLEYVRVSKEPTTKSVVYEDSVAVTGVVIALVGVALHELTGNDAWDAIAAILIGALLMAVAIGLFRDTKGLVIGESARQEERDELRAAIERHDEVVEVLDLRTMYLGPSTMLVAARIDLADDVSGGQIERLSDAIDAELRERVETVEQVFLDATPRGRSRARPDGRRRERGGEATERRAMELQGKRVAILTASDGVERVELTHPRERLEREGALVTHLTPDGGRVRTFDQTDPGETVESDASIGEADPGEYDVLVLPGGYVNPDLLRREEDAVSFVRSFVRDRKPVGVICHGPWTLIEADAVRGRTLTSVESLKTDIRNAGGEWVDEDVHVDRGDSLLVSGRNYEAVEAFADALVRELQALGAPAR